MIEDQIKQIQDRFSYLDDINCVDFLSNGEASELLSMCRSLLEETMLHDVALKNLIEYHRTNSRDAGFRDGVEAAWRIIHELRHPISLEDIDNAENEIRALLPSTQTKEEG